MAEILTREIDRARQVLRENKWKGCNKKILSPCFTEVRKSEWSCEGVMGREEVGRRKRREVEGMEGGLVSLAICILYLNEYTYTCVEG